MSNLQKNILKNLFKASLFFAVVVIALEFVLHSSTFPTYAQRNPEYNNIKSDFYYLDKKKSKKIGVLFNKKKDSKDVFIYFHGNAGRLPYIINYLNKNHSFISPALIGYNNSSKARPSVKNSYLATKKLIDFLDKHFSEENLNFHIIGHSLGSQTAMYFVSKYQKKIKSLSIIAGFDNVYNLCKDNIAYIDFICLVAKNSFDNLALLDKKLDLDYFQFHLKTDGVIPYKRGVSLFNQVNANNKKFINLRDGSHSRFDLNFVLNIITK